MNDYDLSVIVPVYNAEKYVASCITSIMQLRIDNLEIILVDDGSSDRSYEICQELSKADTRIQLIKKSNEGSASARNTGISLARGKYISFIDSDDTIDSILYAKIFDEIVEKDLDVGCFGIMMGDKPMLIEEKQSSIWEKFIKSPVYMHSLCNKFFKKDLIRDIWLDEDLTVCEDMLFCAKAFIRANSVEFYDDIAYNYRIVEQSVTHATNNIKKSRDDIEAAERLRACYDEKENEAFTRFIDYRHQIAALRYLTEIDVFSINEYTKCVSNKDAYKDLSEPRHRLLCLCANKKINIVPFLYILLKKQKVRRNH